ncbi:MAG: DUF3140 domain-containing protein [Hyphomicrobiaceae bacterium]
MTEDDRSEIRRAFNEAVNMSVAEIEDWLATDKSKGVGMTREGDEEAVGHKSGRRIVDIKRREANEFDDADYAHMRKVVGYVHRHLAQRPAHDVTETRWRYSLMNWGHDPLKQ